MKDNHFDFRITEIKHGWIFAQANILGHTIDLANTYLGGLELPKALLRVSHALLTGRAASEWLCWHGESRAQIWHMEESGGYLRLNIYEAGSSFGLPVCGEGLERCVRHTEPAITARLDVFTFANRICEAFKDYRYGDTLAQWQNSEFKDYFPEEEYKILRQALKKEALSGVKNG